MTPPQIEKSSIGLYAAATILVAFCGWTWWAGGKFAKIDGGIETVTANQEAGQVRAEQRQAETERRIDEVVVISRDRNTALDSRIRPLEAQAAATTATLQSINNNLIQLGADIRELARETRENEPPEGKKP